MKETVIDILTSEITRIAVELIIAAVLVFFVVKYSGKKKEILRDREKSAAAVQYRELDEMLVNKRRRSK